MSRAYVRPDEYADIDTIVPYYNALTKFLYSLAPGLNDVLAACPFYCSTIVAVI